MPVPILLYHHIAPPPPSGTPSRSNYVRPASFAKQMQWLKKLGVRGLSLAEAMPYIRGEKQGKVAAITFDDGFMSVYDNAMPVLNALGFSATIFFVTNQIGGQNDWDRPEALRAPCMRVEEVRDWVSHGHEAGSHTLSHPHLTRLEKAQAHEEITQSKLVLEGLIDQPIRSFAYPYGDENRKICDMVHEAGYSYGVTTRRGRASAVHDAYELPRHSIRRNDTIVHFLLKCLIRK